MVRDFNHDWLPPWQQRYTKRFTGAIRLNKERFKDFIIIPYKKRIIINILAA